jgi:AcrR family transcriptional regulator
VTTSKGTDERVSGREKLLQAAAALFARGGYEEVSVAEILAESGLKAPSLYHHFGDKEGLYVAWAIYAIEDAGERLQNLPKNGGAVKGALEAISHTNGPELSQLVRDARLLARDESKKEIIERLHARVIGPLSNVLDQNNATLGLEPQAAACFVLHGAGAMHPLFVESEGCNLDTGLVASALVGRK